MHVHAGIAANIAIDIPYQTGLLPSLSSMVGGIVSLGNMVKLAPTTTTVLNLKADADVTVSVGLATDLRLALPEGCTALFTSESIFGAAQVCAIFLLSFIDKILKFFTIKINEKRSESKSVWTLMLALTPLLLRPF